MTQTGTQPGKGVVLVAGATGRQGSAVTRRLLSAGWRVRAMTRNTGSNAADELHALGADVVEADLDDRSSLDVACAGSYGVFSVQDFWEAGYDREIAQGKRLLDAASAAGAQHFIYSSVGGVDRSEGRDILHFDTKREIEAHIRASGIRYTVFRPVTFFENFVDPNAVKNLLERGVFQFPFAANKPFQMIALDDLGVAVVQALNHPDQFSGMALELASATLTMEDFVTALSEGSGRQIVFQELPYDVFETMMNAIVTQEDAAAAKAGPSFLAQHRWHMETAPETGGWAADLAQIDGLGLQRTSAREWAAGVAW